MTRKGHHTRLIKPGRRGYEKDSGIYIYGDSYNSIDSVYVSCSVAGGIGEMNFVNLDDPYNRWSLKELSMVTDLVKKYVSTHNEGACIKNVEVLEVENKTWSDPENMRYDVTITFTDENNHLWWQKLLILKGEILDGNEFHQRIREFYPR